MNPLESLMLEGVPHGLPPKVDTSDGPTACLMRLERQRALWVMAHDTADNGTVSDLSEEHGTVAS